MIDWTKLKPYHHDKRKSFEQLCFQVAKKLHGSLGKFTPIDDSGGGDGVEFFLTLQDGTEWGWQAKFYFPQLRLNDSRKRSIIESLETSKTHHNRLTKWFLCTPTDFVISGQHSELQWFEQTLSGIASDVELVHWGDSEFSDMLADPQMIGKYSYFFGDFEFSPDWFAHQVSKQLVKVRDKFYPKLHTETEIDLRAHCLVGDDTLQKCLTELLGQISAEQQTLISAARKIREEWSEVAALIHIITQFDRAVTTITASVLEFQSLINEGRIEEARKTDLSAALASIHAYIEEYDHGFRALYDSKIKSEDNLSEEDKSANERAHSYLSGIYKPLAPAHSLASLLSTVSDRINDLMITDLHIFGDAGTGKTHLICHICDERANSKLPAMKMRKWGIE